MNGTISGLQVKWIEHKDKLRLGVGVIPIPQQSNDDKPFLSYEIDENGKTRRIVFGIASRKEAHSVPSTAGELRKALKNGMSNTATRLTSIQEQLANLRDQLLTIDANQNLLAAQLQKPPAILSPDPLDSRIEQALEDT